MKFNGTVLPNKPIEIIIEDPLGKEIFSDMIIVDRSGFVNFEYQLEQSAIKGTYTIIVSQEKEKEIIFTGVGQLPLIPVNLKSVGCHHNCDVGHISWIISGPASTTLSLQIIDSLGHEKFIDNEIILPEDGRLSYELDIQDYSAGVYSITVSHDNFVITKPFAVGHIVEGGAIHLKTTKTMYHANDSILIQGETHPNNLFRLQLIDPSGNIILEKETFSDKDGKITIDFLKIPNIPTYGIWQIKATNDPNFDIVEIEVVSSTN